MQLVKKLMEQMPNSGIMNELYCIPNEPQEIEAEEIYIEDEE